MTKLYLVPNHRNATPPPSSSEALLNAKIVRRMDDENIARVLTRVCEGLDREEATLRLRTEMRRQLREVRTKLEMKRFAHCRQALMREQERLERILNDDSE